MLSIEISKFIVNAIARNETELKLYKDGILKAHADDKIRYLLGEIAAYKTILTLFPKEGGV